MGCSWTTILETGTRKKIAGVVKSKKPVSRFYPSATPLLAPSWSFFLSLLLLLLSMLLLLLIAVPFLVFVFPKFLPVLIFRHAYIHMNEYMLMPLHHFLGALRSLANLKSRFKISLKYKAIKEMPGTVTTTNRSRNAKLATSATEALFRKQFLSQQSATQVPTIKATSSHQTYI